jgi:hypothetical protein
MRFAVAYLVVGLVVLFVPKWPWRLTYRIYRRLSGHHHRHALDGAASPVIERKRFASEAINFDEDTDRSDDGLSRNAFAIENDEESCENMMKVSTHTTRTLHSGQRANLKCCRQRCL